MEERRAHLGFFFFYTLSKFRSVEIAFYNLVGTFLVSRLLHNIEAIASHDFNRRCALMRGSCSHLDPNVQDKQCFSKSKAISVRSLIHTSINSISGYGDICFLEFTSATTSSGALLLIESLEFKRKLQLLHGFIHHSVHPKSVLSVFIKPVV